MFFLYFQIDRYPFDWRNPVGFVFATVLQTITMLYVNLLISTGLSAGVGVYMWAMSMAKDIKNNLNLINEIAKSKRKRSNLLKLLSVTVGYHSTSKKFRIEPFSKTFISFKFCFEKNKK